MYNIGFIPGKKTSTRCFNKNWREFIDGKNIVDYVFETIPDGIFEKIILSTNNEDYRVPQGVEKHLRAKSLSHRDSKIEDTMQAVIKEYKLKDDNYLWMLNPTTPFRLKDDYYNIAKILKEKKPISVISAVKIHPFIWKNQNPQFNTKEKRRNTQDFTDEYYMENGMFFVINIGFFRKHGSWYGDTTVLYKQDKIWCFCDIDEEDDFNQAQSIARTLSV